MAGPTTWLALIVVFEALSGFHGYVNNRFFDERDRSYCQDGGCSFMDVNDQATRALFENLQAISTNRSCRNRLVSEIIYIPEYGFGAAIDYVIAGLSVALNLGRKPVFMDKVYSSILKPQRERGDGEVSLS